jgi:hypothetical protein
MTADLLLLLLGTVLILAGVLAGTVPGGNATRRTWRGRTPRIVASSAGVLCVAAGLIVLSSDDYSAGAVRVTITGELAPEEVSEEIRVFLDGREVGVVKVDERSPKRRVTVTVAKTGRHAYRLESKRQVKGQKPSRVTRNDYVSIGIDSVLGIYYGPEGEVFLLRER